MDEVEGELDQAIKSYDRAIELTEERNLVKLSDEFRQSKGKLLNEYNQWKKLKESEPPFEGRIKKSQIDNYIRKVSHLLEAE